MGSAYQDVLAARRRRLLERQIAVRVANEQGTSVGASVPVEISDARLESATHAEDVAARSRLLALKGETDTTQRRATIWDSAQPTPEPQTAPEPVLAPLTPDQGPPAPEALLDAPEGYEGNSEAAPGMPGYRKPTAPPLADQVSVEGDAPPVSSDDIPEEREGTVPQVASKSTADRQAEADDVANTQSAQLASAVGKVQARSNAGMLDKAKNAFNDRVDKILALDDGFIDEETGEYDFVKHAGRGAMMGTMGALSLTIGTAWNGSLDGMEFLTRNATPQGWLGLDAYSAGDVSKDAYDTYMEKTTKGFGDAEPPEELRNVNAELPATHAAMMAQAADLGIPGVMIKLSRTPGGETAAWSPADAKLKLYKIRLRNNLRGGEEYDVAVKNASTSSQKDIEDLVNSHPGVPRFNRSDADQEAYNEWLSTLPVGAGGILAMYSPEAAYVTFGNDTTFKSGVVKQSALGLLEMLGRGVSPSAMISVGSRTPDQVLDLGDLYALGTGVQSALVTAMFPKKSSDALKSFNQMNRDFLGDLTTPGWSEDWDGLNIPFAMGETPEEISALRGDADFFTDIDTTMKPFVARIGLDTDSDWAAERLIANNLPWFYALVGESAQPDPVGMITYGAGNVVKAGGKVNKLRKASKARKAFEAAATAAERGDDLEALGKTLELSMLSQAVSPFLESIVRGEFGQALRADPRMAEAYKSSGDQIHRLKVDIVDRKSTMALAEEGKRIDQANQVVALQRELIDALDIQLVRLDAVLKVEADKIPKGANVKKVTLSESNAVKEQIVKINAQLDRIAHDRKAPIKTTVQAESHARRAEASAQRAKALAADKVTEMAAEVTEAKRVVTEVAGGHTEAVISAAIKTNPTKDLLAARNKLAETRANLKDYKRSSKAYVAKAQAEATRLSVAAAQAREAISKASWARAREMLKAKKAKLHKTLLDQDVQAGRYSILASRKDNARKRADLKASKAKHTPKNRSPELVKADKDLAIMDRKKAYQDANDLYRETYAKVARSLAEGIKQDAARDTYKWDDISSDLIHKSFDDDAGTAINKSTLTKLMQSEYSAAFAEWSTSPKGQALVNATELIPRDALKHTEELVNDFLQFAERRDLTPEITRVRALKIMMDDPTMPLASNNAFTRLAVGVYSLAARSTAGLFKGRAVVDHGAINEKFVVVIDETKSRSALIRDDASRLAARGNDWADLDQYFETTAPMDIDGRGATMGNVSDRSLFIDAKGRAVDIKRLRDPKTVPAGLTADEILAFKADQKAAAKLEGASEGAAQRQKNYPGIAAIANSVIPEIMARHPGSGNVSTALFQATVDILADSTVTTMAEMRSRLKRAARVIVEETLLDVTPTKLAAELGKTGASDKTRLMIAAGLAHLALETRVANTASRMVTGKYSAADMTMFNNFITGGMSAEDLASDAFNIDSVMAISNELGFNVIGEKHKVDGGEGAFKTLVVLRDEYPGEAPTFLPKSLMDELGTELDGLIKEMTLYHSKSNGMGNLVDLGPAAVNVVLQSLTAGVLVGDPKHVSANIFGNTLQVASNEGMTAAVNVTIPVATGPIRAIWAGAIGVAASNTVHEAFKFHERNAGARAVTSSLQPYWNPIRKAMGSVVKAGSDILPTITQSYSSRITNDIFAGKKGTFKTKSGSAYSYDEVREMLADYGMMDAEASHEFLQSTERAGREGWTNKLGGAFADSKRGIADLNTDIERRQRSHLFMHLLSEGADPRTAKKRATNALFDWSHDYSQWELAHVARVVPFYRFHKQALKYGMRALFEGFEAQDPRFLAKSMMGQTILGRSRNRAQASHAVTQYVNDKAEQDETLKGRALNEQRLTNFQPSYMGGATHGFSSVLSYEQRQAALAGGFDDTHAYYSSPEDGALYGIEFAMNTTHMTFMAGAVAANFLGNKGGVDIGATAPNGYWQEHLIEHTAEMLGFKSQIIDQYIMAFLGKEDSRDKALVKVNGYQKFVLEQANWIPLGAKNRVTRSADGGWQTERHMLAAMKRYPLLGSELGPYAQLLSEWGVRRSGVMSALQAMGGPRMTTYNVAEDMAHEPENVVRGAQALFAEAENTVYSD